MMKVKKCNYDSSLFTLHFSLKKHENISLELREQFH